MAPTNRLENAFCARVLCLVERLGHTHPEVGPFCPAGIAVLSGEKMMQTLEMSCRGAGKELATLGNVRVVHTEEEEKEERKRKSGKRECVWVGRSGTRRGRWWERVERGSYIARGSTEIYGCWASIADSKIMVGLWCTAATRKAESSQTFLLLLVYGAPLWML
uniref:Uncharacterized protein n=1 Tax=Hyaloperonospora arabidopsidis (strain Emoy2) TaxID=559515 RepID=M4BX49_HYAAE